MTALPDTEELPVAPEHTLTVIAGTPRERGRRYGRLFADGIREFLDKELFQKFVTPKTSRDDLLRYASGCFREVSAFSPEIAEELGGMAEGAGLRLEEVVLVTLHEEVYHRGDLPAVAHCTAMAAGPPDTRDGNTYVAESWDWMKTAFGLSQMTLWKRTKGPSVLAYSYPGLYIAAGLNSAGIALVWTSAALKTPGPKVGIPSYVLIAQMLYQTTLKDAAEVARSAKRAGWFSFVLADAHGQLMSVEGSPDDIEVVLDRGSMARVYYASARMNRTPPGQPVPRHPQCQRMCDLLAEGKGRLDAAMVRGFFGDHQTPICKHLTAKRGGGSLDVMVFNPTQREAYVTRGPACRGRWKTFRLDDQPTKERNSSR
jgi:isopenicillin-N N-acyltransferase-like protein